MGTGQQLGLTIANTSYHLNMKINIRVVRQGKLEIFMSLIGHLRAALHGTMH